LRLTMEVPVLTSSNYLYKWRSPAIEVGEAPSVFLGDITYLDLSLV